MEETELNPHERLKKKLDELEREWTAMKTGKSSSAVSCITVEEALNFVRNSPRELMLSLQRDETCQEEEMVRLKSPIRRKLFDDDDLDDEIKTTSLSHSSCCWSSNVTKVRDNDKNKKKSGKIVYVSMVMFVLLVLVVLMNSFDDLFVNRQIDTLVPT